MRLTSAHRELLFHLRIFLGVSGRSDLRPDVLSPRLRHAVGRETLHARSTYTGVRPSRPARFCRTYQLRIGAVEHRMIAHAEISVNASYADMVNADGANSLNLKTCCCAKCAEVALHPSKGRFAPRADVCGCVKKHRSASPREPISVDFSAPALKAPAPA